jgi:hypothetical protein
MKDELRAALETVMDEFDQKRSDAAKRQEAMRTKETEFSRNVERLFTEVIRPAMEQVENTLGQRKHDCKITEEKQTGTTDIQQFAAHISLTIKPAPPTGGGHTMMASRTICFAVVRPEGKIVVGTTSSLPVRQVEGVRGSYDPSKLTPEEVQKQLVTFVKEVFA